MAISPALEGNFFQVLQDHTAGDPMRAEVKWTNLSRRQIAERLAAMGTPAGRDVVSQLLRKHGYRRRKALKKKTIGRRHPDRNAQFENLARLKREYLAAGLPVISVDTKKKELLGDFYREGTIDTQETIETNDHDFASAGSGAVIPHGIYDVGRNRGFLHLNTSHDTSELACDSIAAWWDQQGRADYPEARRLLVLCDGGGSNSATRYVFKEALQNLANRLGLEIRVAHYPPYCSKYNPIEHRLFPHVTRACRGVIFQTLETIRHYMGVPTGRPGTWKTSTRPSGCAISSKSIPSGICSQRPLRVRSGWSKARVPTTRRGRASVTPRIIFPPPSLARAHTYLPSSSKSKRFVASLNSQFSPSLPRIHPSSRAIRAGSAVMARPPWMSVTRGRGPAACRS